MEAMQEKRRAVVGIYSDRMVLSVQEKNYCIYRKQVEEDFLDDSGKGNISLMAEKIKELSALAQKLECAEISVLGYGLLRYCQGMRKELETKVHLPVFGVSGARQAEIVRESLFSKSVPRKTAGICIGDMSSQLVCMEQGRERRESFPLGWRMLWQEGTLIPDRLGEEKMRRQIRNVLHSRDFCFAQDKKNLLAAGMDEMIRFLYIVQGENRNVPQEIALSRNSLKAMIRMMHNQCLRWLSSLEQASEKFPQKIFCQLVLLDELMEFTGADTANLQTLHLEEGSKQKEGIFCL